MTARTMPTDRPRTPEEIGNDHALMFIDLCQTAPTAGTELAEIIRRIPPEQLRGFLGTIQRALSR